MMEYLAADLEQYSHVAAELDTKLRSIISSALILQQRMEPVNRNVNHLQTRKQNIEMCLEEFSQAQAYHNTGKQVDSIIHNGPSHNLEEFLPAMDNLQEAVHYFEKNNPNHVEHTHLKSLYETGEQSLKIEFYSKVRRYTHPVDSEALRQLIDKKADGKEDEELEDRVFGSRQREMADLRRIAAWFRTKDSLDYLDQYSEIRRENVVKSLANLKEFICNSGVENITGSPSLSRKMNRGDGGRSHQPLKRRTSLQRHLSSSADFVSGLQQRRPSKKGAMQLLKDSGHKRQGSADLREENEDFDVTAFTYQINAMLLLLRHEVELLEILKLACDEESKRRAFDTISQNTLMHILSEGDVLSRILNRSIVKHKFDSVLSLFEVLKLYTEVKKQLDQMLSMCSEKTRMMFTNHVNKLTTMAVRNLESYSEFIRSNNDRSGVLPRDGNVHELTVNTLSFLEKLHDYGNLIGTVILMEQHQSPEKMDEKSKCRALGEFIAKTINSLTYNIVKKAEGYSEDCIRNIFIMNNVNYMLVYVTKHSMKKSIYQWNYKVDDFFKEKIDAAQSRYINHIGYTLRLMHDLKRYPEHVKSMDSKEKDGIKDMWEGFNNQFTALYKNNRQYIVEDTALKERLIAEVKKAIVPQYVKFSDCYSNVPFSSKKSKYIKYSAAMIEQQIESFFTGDTAL